MQGRHMEMNVEKSSDGNNQANEQSLHSWNVKELEKVGSVALQIG